MNQIPAYSYDKEGDVLYISFSPGEKATSAVELNDNILLRFNRAEKRAIGLTLMDFSVLVQKTDFGPESFPLNGLKDLEPEWQETVTDIITKPPVSLILKVSCYLSSLSESVPVGFVENLSVPTGAITAGFA
jgi:uncharacterized protein YuzE